MTIREIFASVLVFSWLLSSCTAFDSGTGKKANGLISTPISYYSTPKAKYLGTKYKEHLDRLVEQIVRNPKTASLQFANNISSVGGIGFFTHSATKTSDERYLEVVLATPETFETKGDYSEKIQRLFSQYGFDLLNILSSDRDLYQDGELAGYGLNLAWRDVVTAPSGNRVMLARAIIYLPKEEVRRYLRDEIKQNDLLADAVIFGEEEDKPLALVSYQPQEIRADSRPAIREDNLADGNKSNPNQNGAKPSLNSANQKPEVGKGEAPDSKPMVSGAPLKASAEKGNKREGAATAVEAPTPVAELPKANGGSAEETTSSVIDVAGPKEGGARSSAGEPNNQIASTPKSFEQKSEGNQLQLSSKAGSALTPVETSSEKEMATRKVEVAAEQPKPPTEKGQATLSESGDVASVESVEATKPSQVNEIQSSKPPETTAGAEAAPAGTLAANLSNQNENPPVLANNGSKETGPLKQLPDRDSHPEPAATNVHSDLYPPVEESLVTAKNEPTKSGTAVLKSLATQTATESKPAVAQPAENFALPTSQNATSAVQIKSTTSSNSLSSKVLPGGSSQSESMAIESSSPTSGSTGYRAASNLSATVPLQDPIAPGKSSTFIPNVSSQLQGSGSQAFSKPASPGPTSRQKSVEDKSAQNIETASQLRAAAVPGSTQPVPEQLASIKKPTGTGLEKKPVTRPAARMLEGYIIQIAFNDKDKAQRWAEAMEQRGYAVSVTEAGAQGALRVRLGNFAIRDEAERQLRNFKQDGMNGIIINLPQGFQPARSSVP